MIDLMIIFLLWSCKREPEREEQTDASMPPKFKRHLNDDEVTGSVRSERVRHVPLRGIVGMFNLNIPSSEASQIWNTRFGAFCMHSAF